MIGYLIYLLRNDVPIFVNENKIAMITDTKVILISGYDFTFDKIINEPDAEIINEEADKVRTIGTIY